MGFDRVALLRIGLVDPVLDLEDLDRIHPPASLGAVPGTCDSAVLVFNLAQAPVFLVAPAETLVSILQT